MMNIINGLSQMPGTLLERIIKTSSDIGDIVLNPFTGSGTTAKVAKELNRKSIVIELQPKFAEIIKERCGEIREVIYAK